MPSYYREALGNCQPSFALPFEDPFDSISSPPRLPGVNSLLSSLGEPELHLDFTQREREGSSPYARATDAALPMYGERVLTTPSPMAVRDDGEPNAPSPNTRIASGKKRPRYLRDVDRRNIILRIENGEKQAALAREFGVTRAAICHIKKNRDEIISRYDSLVKSALEMVRGENMDSPMGEDDSDIPVVQRLTRQSVFVLLTTLRDASTPCAEFRSAGDRLMMILLEEALASIPPIACEVRTTTGAIVRGIRGDPRVCCVSVGEEGLPLMRLYHKMDPRGLIGCVHLLYNTQNNPSWPAVDKLELPRELTNDSSVLLFSCTSSTGASVCASIRSLIQIGVEEDNIRVVTLACTVEAVEEICGQFPAVGILTCAIDEVPDGVSPITSLGNFLDRYSGVKPEPLHRRGRDSWSNSHPETLAHSPVGH